MATRFRKPVLVLVVVALAVGLIVAWWVQARRQAALADLRGCEQNVRDIATALEMYATDFGGRLPGRKHSVLESRHELPRLLQLGLVPRYLKAIPTCPAAGRDTYSQGYRDTLDLPRKRPSGDSCGVQCRGRHHVSAGAPPDFPAWTSLAGLLKPTRESTTPCPLPEELAVDGVSLGDNRAVVRKKWTQRPSLDSFVGPGGVEWISSHSFEGPWGVEDDDTFLPLSAAAVDATVLYDSSDRACMARGTILTAGVRLLGGEGTPTAAVLSILGTPDWKVEVYPPRRYFIYIFERGDTRLTLAGGDSLTAVTLVRVFP